MLHITQENETPIESHYYHSHETFNYSENQNTTHNIIDYTKQELEGFSSTKNLYQNPTNIVQPPKE